MNQVANSFILSESPSCEVQMTSQPGGHEKDRNAWLPEQSSPWRLNQMREDTEPSARGLGACLLFMW